MKYDKTIVLLNLRFSDYLSQDLLKNIKGNVRLVAVLDQQFQNKIPSHIGPYLDKIYLLKSNPKMGFLGEFTYHSLKTIIHDEIRFTQDLRIVCSDEFNLLNTGKLREEFDLEGHRRADLLPFRDKVKMKELLLEKKIRVPRFKQLRKEDTFDSLRNEIGIPFVIKLTDSCGSHGVYVIHNVAAFDLFKKNNAEYQAFEVEEFVKGSLFHVDACIKNNEIKFICANQYTYPNFEFILGKPLGSFPLGTENPLTAPLVHFAKNTLSALNANNLISHMELFVNEQNEIIFLEASARPPGALLGITHPINFGINLMDEDFKLQSGLDISGITTSFKEKAFFVLFPLKAGKVVKLNNPIVNSRYDLTWNVRIGDYIDKNECTNIVSKAAHAVFYNEDISQLAHDFELMKHHQALEVCV